VVSNGLAGGDMKEFDSQTCFQTSWS